MLESNVLDVQKTVHPRIDSATTGDKKPTDVSRGQDPGLNPTSSDIVQKYEEMFSSRYSDKDKHFKRYKEKGMDPPPIIENYFIRPQKRSWNDGYRDQRNNQDRSYGSSKRPHYDHGSHHHERYGGWGQQGHNQHWDHSSQNQDWRQRDRPGQGSQRGHRDRYSDGRHDRWSNDRPDERHHDSRKRSHGRDSSHHPHDEWT